MKLRTLVLPVAGLGKRLQPLTFRTPKNLLKVHNTPLIEYALKEGVQAGISRAVIVISPQHREQYDAYLTEASGKFPELEFHIREQKDPFGDGHAVLQAQDVLGSEPFAVRFCDDVIVDSQPSLPRLIGHHEDLGASAIFLERVPQETVSRYGVVAAEQVRPQLYRITGAVEKPAVHEAPSNLIIIGGYVLQPDLLERLKFLGSRMQPAADSLRISHALSHDIKEGGSLYGWEFPGIRLDCGTLEGLDYAERYMKNWSSKTAEVRFQTP
jgi:UTP--glucose-1-phosphate uridylyltransferase